MHIIIKYLLFYYKFQSTVLLVLPSLWKKSEIELAKELIKCPSVTPKEAGAISLLEKKLSNIGFKCHRLSFGEKNEKIENLFAKIGSGKPHFSFCGHVDVVPPGDKKLWSYDPFGATINEKTLYGRARKHEESVESDLLARREEGSVLSGI